MHTLFYCAKSASCTAHTFTVPSRPAVTSCRERGHQCSEHTPPPLLPLEVEEPALEPPTPPLPCALKATERSERWVCEVKGVYEKERG